MQVHASTNEEATNHLKSDEIKCSILIECGTQSTWKTLGINPANPTGVWRRGHAVIAPGPHWRKLRAPNTTSLISKPYATKFITFNTNDLRSFATLLKQRRNKGLKTFLRYCLRSLAKLRRSLTGKLFPPAIQMKFH